MGTDARAVGSKTPRAKPKDKKSLYERGASMKGVKPAILRFSFIVPISTLNNIDRYSHLMMLAHLAPRGVPELGSPFCWERGRLVCTEREARNDLIWLSDTSNRSARCGRRVRHSQ